MAPPVKLIVEFHASDMAERAMHMPGIQRDGVKLVLTAEDMITAYQQFGTLVQLARAG